MKNNILILGGKGDSTTILYNKLKNNFNIEKVILEDAPSKKRIIKNRIKRLGLIKVIGQLLFSVLLAKLIDKISVKRKKEILEKSQFDLTEIPNDQILSVNSVNIDETREAINNCSSKIIIVSGTRIIGKKTLSCIDKKFINIHAGITPKYRGVHGGYWAIANNDIELCGVTVHFVDKGVDTGQVIAQGLISPTKRDSFSTYPLLQLKKGIDLLEQVLFDLIEEKELNGFNKFEVRDSKQYYHPTIWGYLFKLITKKVK